MDENITSPSCSHSMDSWAGIRSGANSEDALDYKDRGSRCFVLFFHTKEKQKLSSGSHRWCGVLKEGAGFSVPASWRDGFSPRVWCPRKAFFLPSSYTNSPATHEHFVISRICMRPICRRSSALYINICVYVIHVCTHSTSWTWCQWHWFRKSAWGLEICIFGKLCSTNDLGPKALMRTNRIDFLDFWLWLIVLFNYPP